MDGSHHTSVYRFDDLSHLHGTLQYIKTTLSLSLSTFTSDIYRYVSFPHCHRSKIILCI